MREPVLGVEKIHTQHLNGNEDCILKVVCRIDGRQRLFQALAPASQLVLIINISAQLQEAPHHVREYIFLRREDLDAISFEDVQHPGNERTGVSLPAKVLDENSWLLKL